MVAKNIFSLWYWAGQNLYCHPWRMLLSKASQTAMSSGRQLRDFIPGRNCSTTFVVAVDQELMEYTTEAWTSPLTARNCRIESK